MPTEGTKSKPLVKPPFKPYYELEEDNGLPECVLTHFMSAADFLSGYIDQRKNSVGKVCYKLGNHPDMQIYVISLLFDVNQDQASKIREKMIGNKKLP